MNCLDIKGVAYCSAAICECHPAARQVNGWRCFVTIAWYCRITSCGKEVCVVSRNKIGRDEVVSAHAMKAYVGVEVWTHSFVSWALDGREWSASEIRA